MRVIFIDQTVNRGGGAEASFETLLVGMPKTRVEYTAVLPNHQPLADRLRAKGVSVKFQRMYAYRWWVRSRWGAIKFYLTSIQLAGNVVTWIRLFKDTRPAIVHLNTNLCVEPIIASRICGIPVVVHFRNFPSKIMSEFVFGKKGFYLIMNLAHCWIANSTATAVDIEREAKCPVRVVENGIDLAEFDRKALDPFELPARPRFALVMVAVYSRWKNHENLLRMMKVLCDRRADVALYIAGAGDAGRTSQLQTLSIDLGLEKKVQFLGYLDNVPALLKEADLMVHTADSESFGRVFLEAMASRMPVVAFNTGAIDRVVQNGKTGMLISPQDIQGMVEAIICLLDNPDLRREMGAAGRRLVEANYGANKHCLAISHVYDEIYRSETLGVQAIA